MKSVLNRASRNFLWRHPWQLVLAILGITLGVAVVIAIDLALESALQSFEQASGALSGQASHKIIATDGGLEETLYTRLRVDMGLQKLSPVIQDNVYTRQNPDNRYILYGIDPFIEKTFQSSWQSQLESTDKGLVHLISKPNTALISALTAQRLQLDIGGHLLLSTDNGNQSLEIIGLLASDNEVSRQVMENLIITDIATAQEVLGLFGKLSTIEMMLDEDNSELLDRIRFALPANAQLITSQTQVLSMRQMTRAFSINLTALGLLSLLVGMFLIYNTMTFLVIQRRHLIGCLRLIGVTRHQIFSLIISEALLLAIIGTLTGIIVGIILGHNLLQMVSTTINVIYYRVDSAALVITPLLILKGITLGIGATLMAVILPAWEASKGSVTSAITRSRLESKVRRLSVKAGVAGLLLIAGGLLLALSSGKSIGLGLSSIFLLLSGFALMTPSITLVIMKITERLFGKFFGLLGKLPPRMVCADLSRTGIAIAALMIAIAATIGMDLMINSFRQTVSQWVKASLQADLYVSLPGNNASPIKANTDLVLKNKIAALPDVQMLSSVLHTKVITNYGMIPLSVFELNKRSKAGFVFKQTQNETIWNDFEKEPTIFLTEPYAYHHQIKVGDYLDLQTVNGKRAFQIIGIYADYSGDQGHLAISHQNYQRFWKNQGFTGIGVYLHPKADVAQLKNNIRKLLTANQTVRSDQAIYTASMDVFEQTFTITDALRWLAAGIAFVGVFSALMALQFERTRQLGVLRAIGITPRQLTTLIITETGLIGLVAGVLAIPVGYMVAYVLIFVIYQRSFGWTMEFYLNSMVFYQGLALALAAALLAGIFPALKMAGTKPAEALRTE